MNRRLMTMLLPLTVVSLGACSTVDSDAIATVDDVEMTPADLDNLLAAIPNAAGAAPSDPDNVDDVRQVIGIWVQSQIISGALEDQGIEIPAGSVDQATQGLGEQLPGFSELSDTNRDLLLDLVVGTDVLAQDAAPASEELLDRYAQGPEESGLICVSHILTPDVDTAADVAARLDGGADFAEIAATESIDTGSSQAGGDLGCFELDAFEQQLVPEFVEAALVAEMGVPTDPVASEFGAHVILVRTAENSADGLGAFESSPQRLIADADVSVASRYGTFDADAGGVVPLG